MPSGGVKILQMHSLCHTFMFFHEKELKKELNVFPLHTLPEKPLNSNLESCVDLLN